MDFFPHMCFFFSGWATLWDCSFNHYCSQILNPRCHLLYTYSFQTCLWRHLHGPQNKSFGTCCNPYMNIQYNFHSSFHRGSYRRCLQDHAALTTFSKMNKSTPYLSSVFDIFGALVPKTHLTVQDSQLHWQLNLRHLGHSPHHCLWFCLAFCQMRT